MTKIYLGIDPDVAKSGVAIWNSGEKEFVGLSTLKFFDLTTAIQFYKNNQLVVVIEAGWLNKKSNFHGRKGQSKAVGEKIAKAVGANHQVGKLLIEFCQSVNVDYVEVRPANKKIDAAGFKKITGYEGRTNSEVRDAAMLVFGC